VCANVTDRKKESQVTNIRVSQNEVNYNNIIAKK